MDTAEAFAVLGLASPCDWEDVRRAYRDRLLQTHPDVSAKSDAAGATDAVISAFRLLRELTQDGLRPVPHVEPLVDATELEMAPLVLYAPPGDVFVRMCQAADRIGELSYADRENNVLQVTVSDPEWSPAQLTAELTPDGDCTSALFSLEPLGSGFAPPIHVVVERLAAELRAPASIDP